MINSPPYHVILSVSFTRYRIWRRCALLVSKLLVSFYTISSGFCFAVFFFLLLSHSAIHFILRSTNHCCHYWQSHLLWTNSTNSTSMYSNFLLFRRTLIRFNVLSTRCTLVRFNQNSRWLTANIQNCEAILMLCECVKLYNLNQFIHSKIIVFARSIFSGEISFLSHVY